ncbi:MAG: FkbM family methyltransferase [Nitrospirota bacterium]|nr:FkbM family methyltransferase [Nitrospirota bacterium]
MIIKQSSLREKLRTFALNVFAYLDNNKNADFGTNGEDRFINDLFRYFHGMQVDHLILFDIGANIGNYSRLLAEQCVRHRLPSTIHLFEPTSACFDTLQRSFTDPRQFILNRKAVSDRTGTATIFFDQHQSSLASLHQRDLSTYAIQMDKEERIDAIRLDEYIPGAKIEHIHFIKLDVEGHERAALDGMGGFLRSDFVDFIQFEYGGANLDSCTTLQQLYSRFEKAGFIVAKIMPRGLDIRAYSPWMDNFQYANYVAISDRQVNKLI